MRFFDEKFSFTGNLYFPAEPLKIMLVDTTIKLFLTESYSRIISFDSDSPSWVILRKFQFRCQFRSARASSCEQIAQIAQTLQVKRTDNRHFKLDKLFFADIVTEFKLEFVKFLISYIVVIFRILFHYPVSAFLNLTFIINLLILILVLYF